MAASRASTARNDQRSQDPRPGFVDQRAQGAVDLRGARPAFRARGFRRETAGAQSQRHGAGDPGRRLRALGVERHLPVSRREATALATAAGRSADPRAGGAVDGLAGHGAQQLLALRLPRTGAAEPGIHASPRHRREHRELAPAHEDPRRSFRARRAVHHRRALHARGRGGWARGASLAAESRSIARRSMPCTATTSACRCGRRSARTST